MLPDLLDAVAPLCAQLDLPAPARLLPVSTGLRSQVHQVWFADEDLPPMALKRTMPGDPGPLWRQLVALG